MPRIAQETTDYNGCSLQYKWKQHQLAIQQNQPPTNHQILPSHQNLLIWQGGEIQVAKVQLDRILYHRSSCTDCSTPIQPSDCCTSLTRPMRLIFGVLHRKSITNAMVQSLLPTTDRTTLNGGRIWTVHGPQKYGLTQPCPFGLKFAP